MLSAARELLRFRGLLSILVGRELKARYRGSLLGFVWSLVNPLLLAAVYTVVFSVVFRPRFEGAEPYALVLLVGLFPWIWVSSSLLEGALSLRANASLIRKAVFPVEVLPTVSVVSNLVHFLLALPVLAIALVAGRLLGHEVGGWWMVLLPAIVALQIPMLTGLSLGLAALNVHFKDVRDLLANLLTLLFFLTPIIYPVGAIPVSWLQRVVELNPFTPFILSYRSVLFSGLAPEPILWLKMVLFSFAGWVLGTLLFQRLRETLVEAV